MTPACPKESVFEGWIGRVLDRGLLRRLDAHVETCASCRARMVVAARSEAALESPEEDAEPSPRSLDRGQARQLARLLLARELV